MNRPPLLSIERLKLKMAYSDFVRNSYKLRLH